MKRVGSLQAKNSLDGLLDIVASGEEVVITRGGKPVARLVPEPSATDQKKSLAAAQAIREIRIGRTLGGASLRDLIDEGRH